MSSGNNSHNGKSAKNPMRTLMRLLAYTLSRYKGATVFVVLFVVLASSANIVSVSRLAPIASELMKNGADADMAFIYHNILIMAVIYLIGVFLYCGALAAGAVHALPLPSEEGWNVLGIVFCVLAFLVVGFLATKFARPFIIAVTAATGAVRVTESLQGMWPQLAGNQILGWLMILALAAAGMIVQFASTKKKRK